MFLKIRYYDWTDQDIILARFMYYPDPDETPETEPEPDEPTHSDDWGDTENEDGSDED